MIAETRRFIFRWRSLCRRECPCLNSLKLTFGHLLCSMCVLILPCFFNVLFGSGWSLLPNKPKITALLWYTVWREVLRQARNKPRFLCTFFCTFSIFVPLKTKRFLPFTCLICLDALTCTCSYILSDYCALDSHFKKMNEIGITLWWEVSRFLSDFGLIEWFLSLSN